MHHCELLGVCVVASLIRILISETQDREFERRIVAFADIVVLLVYRLAHLKLLLNIWRPIMHGRRTDSSDVGISCLDTGHPLVMRGLSLQGTL